MIITVLSIKNISERKCTEQITLTSVSCEMLSTARLTLTIRRLTIRGHIFTVTLLVTVDTKATSGARYSKQQCTHE